MRVEFDSVFTPIDHSLPIPLYVQIVTRIDDAIRRGKLQRGTLLPSESAMCEGFTVARSTLRRALAVLNERGVISRERGRGGGTRIESVASISRRPGTFDTVFELIVASSHRPRTRLITFEEMEIGHAFVEESGFAPGTRVVHVLRHRSADDEPVAVLENWIRAEWVRFDPERIERESLDALLHEGGVRVHHAEFELRPDVAGVNAAFLRLDPSAPVIIEERHVYDGEGQYEYSLHYNHPLNERIRGSIAP